MFSDIWLKTIWQRSTGNMLESKLSQNLFYICDALRDLVAFVQFKKREKHPWRKVNFSKVAG